MDQSAFRNLLASSSGTQQRGGPASTPKPRFGAAPPKRAAVTANSAVPATNTDFKPRQAKDAKGKGKAHGGANKKTSDGAASGYRDRAAERRAGKDGDFTEAEKLLENFKSKAEQEELDKQELEEQMKYLGGDAQHSVLVKGLDMALLERMKAKQADESDKTLEDVEDELDRALLEKASGKSKKRTRDDMIAQLKARAAGGQGSGPNAGNDADGGGGGTKTSKFKPIGWKAVGSGQSEPKKKRKKKKKVAVAEEEKAEPDTTTIKDAGPTPVAAEPASVKSEPGSRPLPTPKPTIDLEDEDFDIFGDAGEYKGIGTDSDSDVEDGDKPAREPAVTDAGPSDATERAKKRKYFDDDDEDAAAETTAPATVTQLADKVAEASKAQGSEIRNADGEDGEGEDAAPMRLQPLAGSRLPSARDLLDLDDAAEKEEKRKARKAHFQMKAAERKQAMLDKMTPEQRAQHDHQVMMAYLEKKDKKGAAGKGDDEDEGDGGPGW